MSKYDVKSGSRFINDRDEVLTVYQLKRQGRGYTVIYRSDKCTLANHLYSSAPLTEFLKEIKDELTSHVILNSGDAAWFVDLISKPIDLKLINETESKD